MRRQCDSDPTSALRLGVLTEKRCTSGKSQLMNGSTGYQETFVLFLQNCGVRGSRGVCAASAAERV